MEHGRRRVLSSGRLFNEYARCVPVLEAMFNTQVQVFSAVLTAVMRFLRLAAPPAGGAWA